MVWFRQDLRLSDNPALRAAAASGEVLPIYILDDNNADSWRMGSASRVWLHHSLTDLNQALGGQLRFFRGDALRIIARLVASLPIEAVFWNRCYEPWRRKRDTEIKNALKVEDVEVRSFNASLLWEPWTVQKSDGSPYRVFTPYYQKGCLALPAPEQPLSPPDELICYRQDLEDSGPLSTLALLPDENWHRTLIANWTV
ncbi:MAG: deoxyribodipyrimidine photo-lyase, partial [Gammaproteobacteria bacterium]